MFYAYYKQDERGVSACGQRLALIDGVTTFEEAEAKVVELNQRYFEAKNEDEVESVILLEVKSTRALDVAFIKQAIAREKALSNAKAVESSDRAAYERLKRRFEG